jgi:hypothetical protein
MANRPDDSADTFFNDTFFNDETAYVSTDWLFRSLTVKEVAEFVAYAREHDPPADITICHPVCVAEWKRLGKIPAETA